MVSDRATLFNLLIGLNGYTICSGVINEELNGKNIVAVAIHRGTDRPYYLASKGMRPEGVYVRQGYSSFLRLIQQSDA